MKLSTAQLPGAEQSDDRIFVTDEAVIVLDGASAFRPVPVPAAVYSETLGGNLRHLLEEQQAADLVAVLAQGIAQTAKALDLRPGNSPSSTVAILRRRGEVADILVLGDNLVVSPAGEIKDTRLDSLELEPRTRYRNRLVAGRGYDDEHRAILRELQDQQADRRNQDGGYWIAEADPSAAREAVLRTMPIASLPWVILATDGAYEAIDAAEPGEWDRFSTWTSADLARLLDRLHHWEDEVDPDGQRFPRAKRHDDKSIAVVRFDA